MNKTQREWELEMLADAVETLFQRGSDPLRFAAATSQPQRDTHSMRLAILKKQQKPKLP